MHFICKRFIVIHIFVILRRRVSNRSQTHIKRKACNVRTWKEHLFFNISSTNIDTLVPSLCQWVETHSVEVFCLLYEPFPHLRFNPFVLKRNFTTEAQPLYATKNSQRKQKICSWISFALSPFAPKKECTRERCSSVVKFTSTDATFTTETSQWACACASATYYLCCHEDGLCCYLVIRIEEQLRTLHLFYFHVWPSYWLS
jgi:hypothetical protein